MSDDYPFQTYSVRQCEKCHREEMHHWQGTCKIGRCWRCRGQLHLVERDNKCPDGAMMICDERQEQ